MLFFFKQKTAYEISDWSSDVCSSDLITLDEKHTGKPSAGNPHAGFVEAGAGNQLARVWRQSSTLPTDCAYPSGRNRPAPAFGNARVPPRLRNPGKSKHS